MTFLQAQMRHADLRTTLKVYAHVIRSSALPTVQSEQMFRLEQGQSLKVLI